MFTWRKVFSSSFVVSASRVPLTGTVVSQNWSKKYRTRSRDDGSMPLTTFGVFSRWCVGLPGSMRSGL